MDPDRPHEARREDGALADVPSSSSVFDAYGPSLAPSSTNAPKFEPRSVYVRHSLRAARATTFSWDFHHDVFWWDDPNSPLFESTRTAPLPRTLEGLLTSIYAPDRLRLRCALEVAAQEGRSNVVECRVQKADGSIVWLEARALGTIAEDRSPVRLYGAFVDVSTQKSLESTLRETQSRLQTALIAGNIGTQVWNMQTGEVDSDAISDRLFGATAAEMIANGFDAFLEDVHPDDRAALAGHFAEAFARPSTARWHYRYTRKDHRRVWVAAYTLAEHDEQSRPWRLTTALVDVTSQKRAEERLKLQNSVSQVLERAPSVAKAATAVLAEVCRCEDLGVGVFWSVDAPNDTLRCSSIWVSPDLSLVEFENRLSGFTAKRGEGALGMVWQTLQPVHWTAREDSDRDVFGATARLLGQPSGCAYPVRDTSELFGVLTFAAHTLPENRTEFDDMVNAVSRNLVAFILRQRAEDTLWQLNAELEERVRVRTRELEAANKELESFSYTVSHDLRAPLRTVDGFAQALAAGFSEQLPEEAKRLLTTIREGAQRMGELIDDLLDFSRLSRAHIRKRDVDMEELVRECLQSLQSSLSGRDVEVIIAPLPVCFADRALLKQVWINLLSNAVKYSGKRERARIEVGVTENSVPPAYFVRDNGTGFDMRYAHKLFGVFRRLHRADEFEGTGVGLAIAHRIVSRHGGRIWADAVRDCGATFFFTIEED